MSKFNRPGMRAAGGTSPIQTTDPAPTGNAHGAPGFLFGSKGELFRLAVANFVSEKTFYEDGGARDERYAALVREVAVGDPVWMTSFLGWLRNDANMRSASLVGAIEAARALLAAGLPGGRQIVTSVLQRADEPGEALAYHLAQHGRDVPKSIKRGIADSLGRLYSEYTLLKYDTASHGFRFGDVVELTHPDPADAHQSAVYRAAMARRRGRDEELSDDLPMLMANRQIRNLVAAGQTRFLLDTGQLREAGMTWEDALSLAGNRVDKGQLWDALIPTMSVMATIRNLRNFDGAGISPESEARVIAKLTDPQQIARSRQFPFRFYAAYLATKDSLRWSHPLEKALSHSLANVPALAGRTLVLVDQSPSMWPGYGMKMVRSDMVNADLAKLFGSALALRAEKADLVQYGGTSAAIPFRKGDSVLRTMGKFREINATDTVGAIARHLRLGTHAGQREAHDRIVIVTDEQNQRSNYGTLDDVTPRNVPVYVWNIGGYRVGTLATGPNRHSFAGLTDHAFRMIPALEAGQTGRWPWEQDG